MSGIAARWATHSLELRRSTHAAHFSHLVAARHTLMPAPALMLIAGLCFAVMGVCVKFASEFYAAGEMVFYRGIVGAFAMATLSRTRGIPLRTPVPMMHFWRSISGVASLSLWFYAIGGLPLATAVTLNYMSSVWMALFLIGGSVIVGASRVDGRLVATVMVGFAGVALVLRPTIAEQQLWHGLCGLLSGMLAALAYLQVTTLGRAGEPEPRIVLYFSLGSVVAGLATTAWTGGLHDHTPRGALLLLAIGALATVAQLMMTRAYSIGSTLGIAALQYAGIAWAFLFGVWLFDDPVTALSLLGVALIVGAGFTATLLRTRSAPATAQPADS
jgi:S-adenosylmethionine uptake transporter